ncbi:MAG: hypothetical protein DMG48_05205 [Acidobacteria bacterium]|nr:MAG: hypothetical protein DMG48_05205 [Acidobacteriota bacterium]
MICGNYPAEDCPRLAFLAFRELLAVPRTRFTIEAFQRSAADLAVKMKLRVALAQGTRPVRIRRGLPRGAASPESR